MRIQPATNQRINREYPLSGGPARVHPGQVRHFVPRPQPQCHRPTRMRIGPNPGAFTSESQENTEDHATP